VLLFVFLFNIGGYYVLYLGWRYQSNTAMTARLDHENYAEEETVTIKIPFNLPYQADQSTFKRMEGEFQYKGEFYKLVKQKIEKDTLSIVCIKDHQEKKIFNFMADMAKSSSDSPASTATMKLLNSLIKDYVPSTIITISLQQGWSSDFTFSAKQSFNLLTRNFPVVSPPPKLLS